MPPDVQTSLPQVGMLAALRNRRGIIKSVEVYSGGAEGTLHLVGIEYIDFDGPASDQVIWEREPGATVFPAKLQNLDPNNGGFLRPRDFDALVRSARWSALSPYIDPDDKGPLDRLPASSPLFGAVQLEDYQLLPLMRALAMPRIALLIADDVGLGKTIEAGLVLTELIVRRRARRVLVLCPASLRSQWRDEMADKFSLRFETVDRENTLRLRKESGIDANPWRIFPRVVASFDYLKQENVFEEFRSACQTPKDSPHLPWDLLIVDEAHNLCPSPMGEESDAARLLGLLAPLFEHKIFLTATPHNGRTRSFTGLLERLDPVRFSRTSEMSPAEKERLDHVLIRRLKREINEASPEPRFCRRGIEEIPVALSAPEKRLSSAYQAFRTKVRRLVARSARRGDERAGSFAIEILGKRLLSCPVAFADTWHRYLEGGREVEQAAVEEVNAAKKAMEEEQVSDTEAQVRAREAARVVGSWLKPLLPELSEEARAVQAVLAELGLEEEAAEPKKDARLAALIGWIESRLLEGSRWRSDERVVIFTEFMTSLEYLNKVLTKRYKEAGRILLLHGDMGEGERRVIKNAFNDPADPCRILLATDAASEGLNLQETARFLIHFDIPWNPSRLEQRNGRLDRHGQARDVTVFHFGTSDDADLEFMAKVVRKVETIREDLGAVGEVFERAFERRLILGEDAAEVSRLLDADAEAARSRVRLPASSASASLEEGKDSLEKLAALRRELDLDPDSLRETLEVALGHTLAGGRLEPGRVSGTYQVALQATASPEWRSLLDDYLRNDAGGLKSLAFDPSPMLATVGERTVFRPRKDTALLHMAHPLVRKALANFARLRFPGPEARPRVAVRPGTLPQGADALLLLTVEEIAVNELRETFHHWVHTLAFPLAGGKLGAPLAHRPAIEWRTTGDEQASESALTKAKEAWDDARTGLADALKAHAEALNASLKQALAQDKESATDTEQERFKQRQGELSKLIQDTTAQRLEREIEQLKGERDQLGLFDAAGRDLEYRRLIEDKEEELRRRRSQLEGLRQLLEAERQRVVSHLIPKRYSLSGTALVLPVALEIRVGGR